MLAKTRLCKYLWNKPTSEVKNKKQKTDGRQGGVVWERGGTGWSNFFSFLVVCPATSLF
jgi:hypothetical protein